MKRISNNIKLLGESIDKAFYNRDVLSLEKYLEEAANLKNKYSKVDELAVLEYFIGNAWYSIDFIKNLNKNNIWSYDRIEHINAIKCFRKCVSYVDVSEEIKNNIFLQAYTNIGNMFSNSGRIIYAIESWKKALNISPKFGMAGANLCHGLIYYANYLYDKNHSALILRYCYNGLLNFLKYNDLHEEARITFENDLLWIQKALNKEFIENENLFREYSLGRSKREKKYKKWILDNSLYLNPLNDIYNYSFIAHDVLHLPNMLVKKYKAPVFHGFFNEIKQEYITSRYLFYQYKMEIPENIVHYSDKGRHLIDTLDYPQYGYRYEQLKNAFKTLYSIFDKVAYFINEYFNLGVDRNRVYFRSIWYKNRKVNPVIESLNNNPLRGLFFLSKDFYSNDMEYLELADPDAKDMAEIRNNIEHKYFKIHWFNTYPKDELSFDNLAYSVSENDFAQKTYRLLKSTREAIIYLSLAIHIEENKNRDGQNGKILSLPMSGYD